MSRITGYGSKRPGKHGYGDGLVLMVSPKGTSTWYARLKIGNKETMRKIGRASTRMNSNTAARLCADLVEQARSGEVFLRSDPKGRKNPNQALLGGFLIKWASGKLKTGRWTERHHNKTIERMEKHLLPLWKRPVADLTRPEIVEHLKTIESVDTAGRMFSWIKEALEDGVDTGTLDMCILGRKPAALTAGKGNKRKSYGNDPEAIRKLYRTIELSDRTRSVRHVGLLVLLTGLRISEARTMRVEYIHDSDQPFALIPRAMMKESDRERDDYTVPLSPPAIAIIRNAMEVAVDGWLFAGPRKPKPVSDAGVEKMYRELTDRQHQPHGCRTSLFTWALEDLKTSQPIARSLLDHESTPGVDSRYNAAEFIDDRREILNQWAEVLTNGKT